MRNLYAAMAAVALVGTAASAQPSMPTPAKFVEEAGASDKFEIESARLMITSKAPAIAAFANKMILAHEKSTMMVKAAAKADGLTPKPPELTVMQRTDITALKAVPAGKTKDDLYVKQQKAAHERALSLMQGYAATGSATHLKAAAAKIAPVVQSHIAMLGSL